MRYPCILMDADETLFDFKRAESEAFFSTMARFGGPADTEALARYSAINDGYWKRFEQGEVTKPRLLEARFEDFFAHYGVNLPASEVSRVFMETRGLSGFYLLPGAYELCQRLHTKGHLLYIVTNATAQVQRNRFAQSGLAPYFQGMFISEEMGVQKPHAAFFDQVFAAIGNPPKSQCIILGDSLSSDMRGGRNAGIATCWFNPHGAPGNADCDYIITDLTQFDAVAG